MKRAIDHFLTCLLIIFMIGGGRVCGCEALSWVGIDVHHHGEDSYDLNHHHDCCDEVALFEAALLDWVSVVTEQEELVDLVTFDSKEPIQRWITLSSRKDPPRQARPSGFDYLVVMQRFQV